MIATVFHNGVAYLTPALLFSLVDTFLPFGIAIEIGRHAARGAHSTARETVPAARIEPAI